MKEQIQKNILEITLILSALLKNEVILEDALLEIVDKLEELTKLSQQL